MPLPLFCLAIRVFGNEALPTLAITVPGIALHVHACQLTFRSSRPSRSTTRRARCCCCSPGSSSARSSCSSPSPCSASPLSTSSGRAEGDYAPPPTYPHTHTQHRDRPSTHPRLAALPRPARTLTARPCLRQRGARGRGQGDEATLRWEVRSHREADHVRLPAQLSRGPVNKIVHQLIQWQLTEFSRVEKRQSAANPSPPEDEFASFYVTTALYDLVLLLIEADAQTRRAPRHTQIHNTQSHWSGQSWTDILLSTFIRFRASTPVFFKSFCGRGTLVTPECRRWSARALAATPLSGGKTPAPCPVTHTPQCSNKPHSPLTRL